MWFACVDTVAVCVSYMSSSTSSVNHVDTMQYENRFRRFIWGFTRTFAHCSRNGKTQCTTSFSVVNISCRPHGCAVGTMNVWNHPVAVEIIWTCYVNSHCHHWLPAAGTAKDFAFVCTCTSFCTSVDMPFFSPLSPLPLPSQHPTGSPTLTTWVCNNHNIFSCKVCHLLKWWIWMKCDPLVPAMALSPAHSQFYSGQRDIKQLDWQLLLAIKGGEYTVMRGFHITIRLLFERAYVIHTHAWEIKDCFATCGE